MVLCIGLVSELCLFKASQMHLGDGHQGYKQKRLTNQTWTGRHHRRTTLLPCPQIPYRTLLPSQQFRYRAREVVYRGVQGGLSLRSSRRFRWCRRMAFAAAELSPVLVLELVDVVGEQGVTVQHLGR